MFVYGFSKFFPDGNDEILAVLEILKQFSGEKAFASLKQSHGRNSSFTRNTISVPNRHKHILVYVTALC